MGSRLVHVAVGVVCRGNEVLIARRPDNVHQGGLLEFPGGKLEAGETVPHALWRELREEVGVEANPATMHPLIQIPHDYGDKSVLLDVWRVTEFEGEPRGLEGQPVEWLSLDALRDEDFPAANRPIIRALRLPSRLLITPDHEDRPHLLERIGGIDASASAGVIVRLPGLGDGTYLPLAREFVRHCSGPVFVHGAPSRFAATPGAAGLHLPQKEARQLQERPIPADGWLGVSCHTPEELTHAAAIGADYAFLSPVRHTPSHPGEEPLGWALFASWVAVAPLPVYALGGMTSRDLVCSQECGAQGIAGIRLWDDDR